MAPPATPKLKLEWGRRRRRAGGVAPLRLLPRSLLRLSLLLLLVVTLVGLCGCLRLRLPIETPAPSSTWAPLKSPIRRHLQQLPLQRLSLFKRSPPAAAAAAC